MWSEVHLLMQDMTAAFLIYRLKFRISAPVCGCGDGLMLQIFTIFILSAFRRNLDVINLTVLYSFCVCNWVYILCYYHPRFLPVLKSSWFISCFVETSNDESDLATHLSLVCNALLLVRAVMRSASVLRQLCPSTSCKPQLFWSCIVISVILIYWHISYYISTSFLVWCRMLVVSVLHLQCR